MKEKLFSKFSFKNKNIFPKRVRNKLNSLKNLSDEYRKNMEIKSYIQIPGKAIWSSRNYEKFAEEGYIKNVIVNRCITLIAKSASGVPMNLFKVNKHGDKTKLKEHKILNLLKKPNLLRSGAEFMEEIYSYKLISGNAFIQMVGGNGNECNAEPEELYSLCPDKVSI
ncbi:phage portal protein [Pseudomonadota bacterium]